MEKTQKMIFAFLLAAASTKFQAQTKIFPVCGNAGIGTTTLSRNLDVPAPFTTNN